MDDQRHFARLVPELIVFDHGRSLQFYQSVLGFTEIYGRHEEGFSFLERDGAQLMIDQRSADGSREWIAGELSYPYGRGINLEIHASDANALHEDCVRAGARVFLQLEEKWYRRDHEELGVRQFIVMDPDGYFFCDFHSQLASELRSDFMTDDQGIGQARDVLQGLKLFWSPDPDDNKVTRLGGLTNLVFRVDHAGEQYVLRIPGKGTEEYINRAHEEETARAAERAGVSPDVVLFDKKSGVMVTRLVDGAVTMSPENFKSIDGAPGRAGEALRKLHASGVLFPFRFELFKMVDEYLKILASKDVKLPVGYHDVVREAEGVRAALSTHPLPLVACHCDPLCENFLDQNRKRMWIVDWEYGGMNDPMWDLGDLSVEGGFTAEQDEEMISAYFGCEPSASERGRIVIYKAMCDLLWTLWGLIQHANKNPADDFHAYALNRFGRCKALMADPVFFSYVAAVRKG